MLVIEYSENNESQSVEKEAEKGPGDRSKGEHK